MKYIWSYLMVVLCGAVTSVRVMDYPGNRNDLPGNSISDVKDEKIWTPPTTSGLIIDSNGYPGNSNEARVDNISVDEMPKFFKKVLLALLNENKYEIIPFTKEDITNMESSELCKTMCESGVKKPPCKCE